MPPDSLNGPAGVHPTSEVITETEILIRQFVIHKQTKNGCHC